MPASSSWEGSRPDMVCIQSLLSDAAGASPAQMSCSCLLGAGLAPKREHGQHVHMDVGAAAQLAALRVFARP